MATKKKGSFDALFAKAERNVTKVAKKTFLDIDAIYEQYGVPGYISTGLPSYDLHLLHNEDRTAYGFPRGRFCEIHGEQSSFKTTLAITLASECLAMGGYVYWLTAEYDFDKNYVRRHLEARGITEEQEARLKAIPVATVGDMFKVTKGIVDVLEESADDLEGRGKSAARELPPVLFVVDSVAALLSDADHDRHDKDFDDGPQVGSSAGSFHRFFKFFLEPVARLGICYVMTNHYRANIGAGAKKKVPAHDSAIKYYASLRVGMNAWNPKNNTKTSLGTEMTKMQKISVRVYKTRSDWVCSGSFDILYQYNYGFNYYESLIDCFHRTGVLKPNKKEWSFVDNVEESDPFHPFGDVKYSNKELKQKLFEMVEDVPKLALESLKRGPKVLDDLRLE